MNGWQQAEYNHKDGTAQLANDRRPTDPPVLSRWARLRFAGRRALLRAGPEPRGHSSIIAATRCAAGTTTWRRPRPAPACRFVITNKGYGLLWDNPSKTTIEPGLQRADALDLRSRRPRLVLCDRRRQRGRDLCRLQAADRPHAHAAQGGLRLHPVQAALLEPGGAAGRRQGLSRPPSACGRAGGGLVLLHQDGADGHGPEVLARSQRP